MGSDCHCCQQRYPKTAVSKNQRLIYVQPHISVLVIIMGNMTLSMPDDVQKKMKHFSEVKWSEVARKAIIERVESLLLAEKLAQKSKLTEKDIEEFSKKIKSAATQRFIRAHSH